ncbi:407_t:CDS:2 [Diversispora eburnea]|uniref:Small ribosomal subunit protein bS18m n=1 Tax=Diversispora eburnea TaxID=1213867 RepID=A0A9N8WFG3_9GLOM|nr:407_t:CDS:2 [Diversispora eburnea]
MIFSIQSTFAKKFGLLKTLPQHFQTLVSVQRYIQIRHDSSQTPFNEDEIRKFGRNFRSGEIYAPHDLNEENYKDKKPLRFRKPPPNVDVFKRLNLNPLVEYKNFNLLSNFVSDMGRILPRKKTGLTAKNQRKLAKAIKRARSFGLIPSTYRRQIELDFFPGYRGGGFDNRS